MPYFYRIDEYVQGEEKRTNSRTLRDTHMTDAGEDAAVPTQIQKRLPDW